MKLKINFLELRYRKIIHLNEIIIKNINYILPLDLARTSMNRDKVVTYKQGIQSIAVSFANGTVEQEINITK